MDWSAYGAFLVFALVLVVVPGPDFAVVTKNTLSAGRWRGLWSSVGVATSNVVQGAVAAAGLGVVIVRVEPVFQAVKWAGMAYLVWLGLQAFRSAYRGRYGAPSGRDASAQSFRGWRQGFLSNITNPKVLVFYLAVLPQFLGSHAPFAALLLFASSHAVLSLGYLLLVVTGIHRVRRLFALRRVRRILDLATGCALVGFSVKLATEHG